MANDPKSDELRNKLLEIIADELYIARRDKDDLILEGHSSSWVNIEKPRLQNKILRIREDWNLGV